MKWTECRQNHSCQTSWSSASERHVWRVGLKWCENGWKPYSVKTSSLKRENDLVFHRSRSYFWVNRESEALGFSQCYTDLASWASHASPEFGHWLCKEFELNGVFGSRWRNSVFDMTNEDKTWEHGINTVQNGKCTKCGSKKHETKECSVDLTKIRCFRFAVWPCRSQLPKKNGSGVSKGWPKRKGKENTGKERSLQRRSMEER